MNKEVITTESKLGEDHQMYQPLGFVCILTDLLEQELLTLLYSDEQVEVLNAEYRIKHLEEQLKPFVSQYYFKNGVLISVLNVTGIQTLQAIEEAERLEEMYTQEFLEAYPTEEDYFSADELAEMRDRLPYGVNA